MKGVGAPQLIAEQRDAIVRLRDKLARNEVRHPRPSQRGQRGGDADPERHPALRDGRHLFGRRIRRAMIKFIVAGLWLCAVSIGAVFYSFQMAGAKTAAEPDAGTARRPRLRQDRRALGSGAQAWRHRRLFPHAPRLYGRSRRDEEAVGAGRRADQRPGLHLPLHQSEHRLHADRDARPRRLSATACATASTSGSARR